MKIKTHCKYCNQEFPVGEKRLRKGWGKYCSRNCRNLDKKSATKIICKKCGEEFETQKYLVKKGQKYCSHKCQLISLKKGKYIKCKNCDKSFYSSKSSIEKNRQFCSNKCSSNYKKQRLVFHCLKCKKEIYRTPCQIKRKVKIYCSKECYKKALESKRLNKICLGCGKIFTVHFYTKKYNYGKYCSRDCLKLKDSRIKKICKNCGKSFKINLTSNTKRGRGQFCSIKCKCAGKRVNRVCEYCSKKFVVDLNVVKKGHGKYCSVDCAVKTFPTRMQIKPNYSEKKLYKIINFLFPNEYYLNVLGDFIIDRKIPDFVNINGQKKIIELFGEHVHPIEHEDMRKEVFAKFGYKTLIVWCKELKDEQLLKEKLIEFHNN